MQGNYDNKISDEAKKSRAAYMREWRKKNPQKNKEYIARYWNKKVVADKVIE